MIKCQQCNNIITSKHSKKFCNQSCSAKFNNVLRGPRSVETRKKQSNSALCSLKVRAASNAMRSKETKLKFHNATGEVINKGKQNIHYWSTRIANPLIKVCNWFDIPVKQYPLTINKLDKLKAQLTLDYQNGMSTIDIAKLYKLPIDHSAAPSFLKLMGIQRRTQSEAITMAIMTKGLPPAPTGYAFKHGYHMSWDLTSHYYRSSYELDFMKFLDNKQINYTAEGIRLKYYDTIKNKERVAVPDIIYNNTIIEIKSLWTYDYQNMVDRFKSYNEHGYKTILLLEGKFYRYLPK